MTPQPRTRRISNFYLIAPNLALGTILGVVISIGSDGRLWGSIINVFDNQHNIRDRRGERIIIYKGIIYRVYDVDSMPEIVNNLDETVYYSAFAGCVSDNVYSGTYDNNYMEFTIKSETKDYYTGVFTVGKRTGETGNLLK